MNKIENILSKNEVDIKQMKKLEPEESETDATVLKIIGQYNKQQFNKNMLLKNLSLLDNVIEVTEQ